jgi:hypothetical protein
MTRRQLEQQRERVEAQMRWAVVHGGDQGLLDLLRLERDRLFCDDWPISRPRRCGAIEIRRSSGNARPATAIVGKSRRGS